MKRTVLLFLAVCGLFISAAVAQSGLSGTIKIGQGATYSTLTGAIAALSTNGLNGAVILELQANYTSSGETFPIKIPAFTGSSEVNQVTIRPAANAANLVIQSPDMTFAPTIQLSSATYINIDGRPGGSGTNGKLSIVSNQQTYSAIALIDNCSHNNISYLDLSAYQFNPENGVINLTAADGMTGNTYNTFEHCTIHTIAGKTVYKGIHSAAGKWAWNRFNTVKDCNFYDVLSNFIFLGDNNSDWQISNNNFYTVTVNNLAQQPIYISGGSGSGFVITDNAIGGSGPACSGQKAKVVSFTGITVESAATGFNYILRNKIGNINIDANGIAGIYYPFRGIYINGGNFNCSNNIIGETESRGLDITAAYLSQSISAGIFATSVDSCIISGNKVGGINTTQQNPNEKSHLYGIAATVNAYLEITENIVGSTSVENSFSLSDGSSDEIIGIKSVNNSLTGLNIVRDNIVSHLRGLGSGIDITGGTKHVDHNTVSYLSAPRNAGANATLYGINVQDSYREYGPTGSTISGNTVHSVSFSNGNGAMAIGIWAGYLWDVLIERNLVHSLSGALPYNSEQMHGIYVERGIHTVIRNNMVRLGIDKVGAAIQGDQLVQGLRVGSRWARVVNNSVFVGGRGTGSSSALYISSDSLANINNNILVNNRIVDMKNGSYAGAAYAISSGSAFTSNYNCYYFPQSPNSMLALAGGKGYNDIRAFRKATGVDSNSFVYPPNFINANDSGAVNLHIKGPSPVKGAGSYNSSVAEDFDGDKRDPSSPDIGADAGNYTYQDGDAPMLTHIPFLGQPVKSDYIYKVRVVDNVGGIDTSAANAPRMWLRKSYPQKGTWFSVAGTKLEGNVNESIWGFHPDLSKAGTTLAAGDSLEYYFVAQDKGPIINVGYSNYDSSKHTDVNTQVSAPLNPLRLLVYGIFPDTVYVGTGQQYTSLSNEGGFFQATAAYSFDTTKANVYVFITSDLAEVGTYPMKVLYNTASKINMGTNTAVLKTIRKTGGFVDNYPLVTFKGVSNVVLDGRVNNTGRYLRFECVNTLTGYEMAAMELDGTAENMELSHLEFASNNTKTRVWGGSLTLLAKMKNVRISNNLFTYITSQPVTAPDGSPKVLPMMAISMTAANPDSLIIENNEISNFALNGIILSTSGPSTTGSIRIEGNHFYYNSPVYNTQNPVAIEAGVTMASLKINNNYFGGTAPYCGGEKWTITSTTARDLAGTGYYFTGIKASTPDTLSIQGNVFSGVKTPSYSSSIIAISAGANHSFIGNEIGNIIGSRLAGDTSLIASVNRGIVVSGDNSLIQNNIMAGVYSYSQVYAIQISGAQNQKIIGNKVIGLSSLQGTIFDINAPKYLVISGNQIKDCIFQSTKDAAYGTGIKIVQAQPSTLTATDAVVERNAISNFQCNSAAGSNLAFIGIDAGRAAATFRNNQIGMRTGTTASVVVTGLKISTQNKRSTNQSNRILYNTIYLAGQSQNAENSYGIYLDDVNAQEQVLNNIIYNNRTGGTGKHLAISTVNNFAANANNNLYITSLANAVNKFKTNDAGTIAQWRDLTVADAASYASTTAAVPVDSLFLDALNGNLDINNTAAMSWLVNGKGMPVVDTYNDYGDSAHVRSIAVNTGATDIGSNEFNTATTPPGLTVTGSHTPGGTEQMLYNGRVIASITWGNTGTLPTLTTPLFYSGEWPNDATNNGTITSARYMNGYWAIGATGGSGFTYSLTLSYDSSMLGQITDASNMVLNKREPGANGTWKTLTPSIVDTVARTVTVYNQTSFSEFTLTDSLATATQPARLADLQLISNVYILARQGASFKLKLKDTNIGQGYALPHKIKIYLSTDNILTAADSLLATINVNKLAAGDSVVIDTLSLILGCSLQTGKYYIIAQVDGENIVPEPDKTNNTFLVNINLLPAADLTLSSTKTTACVGEQLTFNASGATSFTFSGEGINNATALSFNVNTMTPGTHTYKASAVVNGCTVEKQTDLVVNDRPTVTATSSANKVCDGQSVTLTGAGATSYIWKSETGAYSGQSYKATYAGTGAHLFMLTGIDQNGCKGVAATSFSVDASGIPAVSIDYSGCPGRVLTFQAAPVNGGDNPTYAWYVNDEYKAAGATYVLNDAYNSQEVYVVMNSSAACVSNPQVASAISKINCTITAVPVIDGMEDYSIYPNPGPGLFYVHMKLNTAKTVKIVVGDNEGNVIKMIPAAMKSGVVKIPIDLSGQPAGVYYIQSTIGNKTFTRKVVKI